MNALNHLIPQLGDAGLGPWPEATEMVSLTPAAVRDRKSHGPAASRFSLERISADVADQILSRVRDVILIVGRDRKIHFLNHAAERLLARKVPLRLRGGRLEADSAAHSVELGRTIDAACANGGGSSQVLVLRRDSAPPLAITICCLRSTADEIMLVASDLTVEQEKVIDPLMRYFGLTRSEAEVAAAIAAGVPNGRIAERRGVQINTVRTQVKAISAKLGCTRQSQIAAVVHVLPIASDGPE